MAIKIYRKETVESPKKPTKADLERLALELEHKCRVRRPSLEALFIPARTNVRSDFYKMEALPVAVIDNRAKRIINHAHKGWAVPADSCGRKAEYDEKKQAQSILLWIKQNLSAVVNPGEVSVVVE